MYQPTRSSSSDFHYTSCNMLYLIMMLQIEPCSQLYHELRMLVNPWYAHARKGYGYSHLFVCLLITKLAAIIYLVYMSKIECPRVLGGIFKFWHHLLTILLPSSLPNKHLMYKETVVTFEYTCLVTYL